MIRRLFNITTITYLVFAGLMSAVSTACTGDDDCSGDGNVVHLSGSITSRGSEYEDNDGDLEIIQSWWIAFVKDGKVETIVERPADASSSTKREGYNLDLLAGTYDVYSFANISKTEVEAAAGSSITAGATMPDISATTFDVLAKLKNGNGTLKSDLDKPIPMTGKETVTFTGGGSQNHDFEVIRMTAKMEFTFKNASTKDITVKSVKFAPFNTGKVLLMPDYTTLALDNEKDPVLLSGADTLSKKITFPVSAEAKLAANSYSTQKYVNTFYMREALASSHPTKHFVMSVGIKRGDKDEELLYSLTDKKFTGINRNDFVQIPIKFTDYVIDIEVNFYPPIGGYPAEVLEKNEKEFYIKFKTQGVFSITPKVYDATTSPSTPLPSSKFDYVVKTPIEVPTPSIFVTEPYRYSSSDIVGQMNENEGTACVDIEVEVDMGGGVSQIYTRRIYIIRQNS